MERGGLKFVCRNTAICLCNIICSLPYADSSLLQRTAQTQLEEARQSREHSQRLREEDAADKKAERADKKVERADKKVEREQAIKAAALARKEDREDAATRWEQKRQDRREEAAIARQASADSIALLTLQLKMVQSTERGREG